MKLIKKSEKILLDKIKIMEEAEEQYLRSDSVSFLEPVDEEEQVISLENREPNYIPSRDNPVVQSVGKSGWQVSDIWRDIRVDNFCD